MFKQLDEFMVTRLPRTWRSRLLQMILISMIGCLIFFLLREAGLFDSIEEEFAWFILLFVGIYWLYLQYRHQPFLRYFSFAEILTGSLLNLICVVLILLPAYFVEAEGIWRFREYDSSYYVQNFFEGLIYCAYYAALPLLFLPFIIRRYSFSEAILILVSGGVLGFAIWLLGSAFFPNYEAGLWVAGLMLTTAYLILLVRVVRSLYLRRYGRWEKWMIFFLIVFAPTFVTILFGTFASPGQDVIIGSENIEDDSFWLWLSVIVSYMYSLILTWYVVRSFEKPMVVK